MSRIAYYMGGLHKIIIPCLVYVLGPILFGFLFGWFFEIVLGVHGVAFSIFDLAKVLIIGFFMCFLISFSAIILEKKKLEDDFRKINKSGSEDEIEDFYRALFEKWFKTLE